MRIFTKSLLTFVLLCVAGIVNAEELVIKDKFKSVSELTDKLFVIYNEDEGQVVFNKDAQNLAVGTYDEALAGTAYYWKLVSLADNEDEAVKDCYLVEAVKEDGSSIGLWGSPAIYLNSGAEGGFDGCFLLGLNNQLGQDCQYGAVWMVEKTANGFALKNKARGGYFAGVNPAPTAEEPISWTFCTIKTPEVPEYVIDKTFKSVAELNDQLFAISGADGNVMYNVNAQNLASAPYISALKGTAYMWKLVSLADNEDEAVKDCYLVEAVKEDGSSIGLWGNPAIYLNSGAEGGFDGCFLLGLNNQLGQDCQYGAVWMVEKTANGFALKNKARGGYFAGVNPAPTAEEPISWTFCTFKIKEPEPEVKPDEPAVLDPAIDDSDPAVVANKAALLTAINKAKAADLTNKTSASKKALADAIAAGEEQLASKNTTLAKIDAARRAILQALDELEDRSAPAAEKAVPEGWKSVITNGNLEGDDMSCFFSKTSAGAPEPSVTVDGEGIDDWHAIVINSTASGASQDWDDQFFIRATEVIPAGTKFHVEFDYRSDVEAGADTQCHVEPGNYIHWACIGSPTFKEEWQHFTFDGKAPSETAGKNFQTIAFNLSKNRKDTKLVIDNIVFWVEKPAPVEIEWKDVINNGNMEGTDVSNFVSKVAPSTDIVAATLTAGAGKDGGKGIKLEIPAKVENPWDSQFWIVLPFAVTDEKMKLEFDYKADRAITVDMQNHEAPGSYKGNLGSVNFTTEWQHFSSETFMTGQSIAFNLSMDEAATYFFDNVKLYLDKTIIATGIENVKTILNNGQIFDLQGRRVAQPAKGLYIKNGKKVLVK